MSTTAVEDLWDLSLEDLDESYCTYSAEIRQTNEDSLLKPRQPSVEHTTNKRAILAFVVVSKQEAIEASKAAGLKREKAARVRELIAKKQDAELEGKSAEELAELLKELGE